MLTSQLTLDDSPDASLLSSLMHPLNARFQRPTKHLSGLKNFHEGTSNEIILQELIQLKVNLAEVREQVEVNELES